MNGQFSSFCIAIMLNYLSVLCHKNEQHPSQASGRTWMWLDFGSPLQLPDYNYLIWWIPSCLAPQANHPKWSKMGIGSKPFNSAYFMITLWWMNIHRSQLFWYQNQGCHGFDMSWAIQETQGWRWCTPTEAASFAWWFHRPWSACHALCYRYLAGAWDVSPFWKLGWK